MIEKVWRELHELMKDIDAADCEDATHGQVAEASWPDRTDKREEEPGSRKRLP